MSDSARPSRSVPSLKVLEESYNASETELRELISADIISLQDKPGELSQLANALKSSFRTHIGITSKFIFSKISAGATAEAVELKDTRSDLRVEVNDCLAVINDLLSKYNIRMSDFSSFASSQSHQSPPSQGTSASNEEYASPDTNLQDATTTMASINLDNMPMESDLPLKKLLTDDAQTPKVSFSISSSSYPTATVLDSAGTRTSVMTSSYVPSHSFPSSSQLPASTLTTITTTVSSGINNNSYFSSVSNPRPNLLSSTAQPFTYRYPPTSVPIYSTHPFNPNNFMPTQPQTYSSFPSSITPSQVPNVPVCTSGALPQPILHTGQFSNAHLSAPVQSMLSPATVGSNMQPVTDPATFHLLRQELFKRPSKPYDGEPSHYHAWMNSLNSRLRGLQLDSWDLLHVLEAQTSGKPQKIVQTFINGAGCDPDRALAEAQRSLRSKFGSETRIAHSLLAQLDKISPIKDAHQIEKLEELLEIFKLIQINIRSVPDLQTFNLPQGVSLAWSKLPETFQNSWRSVVRDYNEKHNGDHPPFDRLVSFLIRKLAEYDHPAYAKLPYNYSAKFPKDKKTAVVLRTESDSKNDKNCFLHPTASHSIDDCKEFAKKTPIMRQKLLQTLQRCYLCFEMHMKSECKQDITCSKCKKPHNTLLHRDYPPSTENVEQRFTREATSYCMSASGETKGLSLSKTLLVDITFPENTSKSLRCYALIDEQSSSSFVDPHVAEFFGIKSPVMSYKLTTISNVKETVSGILVEGLRIKGVGEKKSFPLPAVFTNEYLPDSRAEVATPEIVSSFPQYAHLASKFNPFDPSAQTLILLGRDCNNAMKTRCVGHKGPFIHFTSLGASMVGSSNLQDSSKEKRTFRISVSKDVNNLSSSQLSFPQKLVTEDLNPFKEFPDDESLGLSKEDSQFLESVSGNISINDEGHISLPLPFRSPSKHPPDNRTPIFNWTRSALRKLRRSPDKIDRCVEAMNKHLKAGHVELVPTEELTPPVGKSWYIFVFPVFNDAKGKCRLVFHSAAEYKNVSFNSMLLSGPNLTNDLYNVLLNFRVGQCAFSADIESMFYCFRLKENDKDYTRFFWFRNNNPCEDLVEMRAKVHIYGSTSSPSLCSLGLKYAINQSDVSEQCIKYVHENFYVDDGVMSVSTPDEAVSILRETREALGKFGIRLHKIASNSDQVINSFPNDVKPQTNNSSNSVQKVLGVNWNTSADTLEISIDIPEKPFTKRGVLAVCNSIFDPLKLISPIILTGRLLQRKLIPPKGTSSDCQSFAWDDPLPDQYYDEWESWKNSVSSASRVSVSRCFTPPGFESEVKRELHAFSDACITSTGHVIYMRTVNHSDDIHVALVSSSSRVAPRNCTSIPRLELCAAMEVAISTNEVMNALHINKKHVTLYTDSKIVLGYLNNVTRRFPMYVTRRINVILKLFPSSSWKFVDTENNPGDIASRPQTVNSLTHSPWFCGPSFLWTNELPSDVTPSDLPENLPETLEVKTLVTKIDEVSPLYHICMHTSSLNRAINIARRVFRLTHFLDKARQRLGISLAPRNISSSRKDIMAHLIRSAQRDMLTSNNCPLQFAKQPLASYSPFIDKQGVVRVGGRLKNAALEFYQKYPILLPSNQPLTTLIVTQIHENVAHQGRVITQGAIRQSGYFVQHGNKIVKRVISQCVLCKRLRGQFLEQKMSDLPFERVQPAPPFSSIGTDVLGPFVITDGKSTRRTCATKKIWAVIFTCLSSRAVHFEPLPMLDTSSMKNALRRLICLRGFIKKIRSDRGTNFVGVRGQDSTINMSDIQRDLQSYNIEWELNPAHAPHYGGIWERQVGSMKRIFEGLLLQMGKRSLSRDEFVTLLAECASIINHTPLTSVSSDPSDPLPISPATLLFNRSDNEAPPSESFNERDLAAYGARRWRRIQHLSECFWQRWRQEYLQNLQKRQKWTRTRRSLKVGDVVLMKSKSEKRNLWPLCKVIAVKKSNDGLVRSTTVQTGNGRTYERPVTELVLLVPCE